MTGAFNEYLYRQDTVELALGRGVRSDAGEHGGLVHVWWRLRSGVDDVVQIYVNDELTDVVTEVGLSERWLILDRGRSLRIELLGVSRAHPDGWWNPRPDLLASWTPGVRDRAAVRLLRDESLPIDTRIDIRREGESLAQGAMWSGDTPRNGFGGLFGLGAYGRDTATGPGLGRGELGWGPLGTDASAWATPPIPLPPGQHELAVHLTDPSGNELAAPLDLPTVTADTLPEAARHLSVDSDFTLNWSP